MTTLNDRINDEIQELQKKIAALGRLAELCDRMGAGPRWRIQEHWLGEIIK